MQVCHIVCIYFNLSFLKKILSTKYFYKTLIIFFLKRIFQHPSVLTPFNHISLHLPNPSFFTLPVLINSFKSQFWTSSSSLPELQTAQLIWYVLKDDASMVIILCIQCSLNKILRFKK